MVMIDLHRARLATGPLLLAGATACYSGASGEKGDDTDTSGASAGSGAGTDGGGDVDPEAAGLRPLRRLTVTELDHTVRDLLGIELKPSDALPPDPSGENGFAEPSLVNEGVAEDLLELAEAMAAQGVARIDDLDDCDEGSVGERECAESFVTNFGARAFRRPVLASEVTELMAVYDEVRQEVPHDHTNAMRVVLTAMLLSPKFLYHWQLPGSATQYDGQVIKLEGYELASRLSYFLWSTMPDDELFAAAGSGALETDSGVDAEIDRMLQDDRMIDTVRSFHEQWLELGAIAGVAKDPTLFPELDEDLRTAMREEIEHFVTHVMVDGDARIRTLFTAGTAFVNEHTAGLYGIDGVSGEDYQEVELDPAKYGGLLTRSGFIAGLTNPSDTNPPRAGNLIFERVLCRSVPPPPPGAADQFMPDDSQSTRWNFEQLEDKAECAGCHSVINPIGFAFESYDALGRYRTMDGPHPVDASGVFHTLSGDEIPFENALELSAILADDPETLDCISNRWWRFALARMEGDEDRASVDQAFGAFLEADADIRVLLGSIARSRTFRFRAPEQGE